MPATLPNTPPHTPPCTLPPHPTPHSSPHTPGPTRPSRSPGVSVCGGQGRGHKGVHAAAGQAVVQGGPRLAARHIGVSQDQQATRVPPRRRLKLLRAGMQADGYQPMA